VSILTFIIILSLLIIVHELGHFGVAKYFGIRVDEFGLGYPPRAKKLFRWLDTDFTLNWLPFGGFVKIYGENPGEGDSSELSNSDSLISKNRGIQSAVLVAGVAGNFLFAWLLISIGFMTGLPAPTGLSFPVENPQTVITIVLPGTPAAEAGLRSGDTIVALKRGADELLPSGEMSFITPDEISNFIAASFEPMTFVILRGGEMSEKVITPEAGIIPNRPAVGVSMDIIGIAKLSPGASLWHGLKTTSELTRLTALAIGGFIVQALSGNADLSSVTGPVGIVGMVGDVRELGFAYLLTFTSLISINLAIINLFPFPALDGGRLFFILIEILTRRRIPPKIFNAVNAVGFALLIFLMILITIKDVRSIF
jgi:regulator of sigma E protease